MVPPSHWQRLSNEEWLVSRYFQVVDEMQAPITSEFSPQFLSRGYCGCALAMPPSMT